MRQRKIRERTQEDRTQQERTQQDRTRQKRTGRIDLLNIGKYGMVLVILVYVVILVVRAGGDAPFETVEENVMKAVSTEGMEKATTQELKKYYGLNADDYEAVTLYLPNDVMGVNELLLIRLGDKSQEEQVTEAAQKRLDTQKESFEGYGVEQTKTLNSAILEARGNYVLLAVSETADAVDRAFKESL